VEERTIVFKEYIESFKQLDIDTKRNEFIKSLKSLIATFDGIAQQDDIKIEYMQSNEIRDLNEENVSESDFIEASMVYLEIAKDIIGQYLIKKENL
jgi:hypothetical protein